MELTFLSATNSQYLRASQTDAVKETAGGASARCLGLPEYTGSRDQEIASTSSLLSSVSNLSITCVEPSSSTSHPLSSLRPFLISWASKMLNCNHCTLTLKNKYVQLVNVLQMELISIKSSMMTDLRVLN
jgi:hypothetical protein